MKRNLNYSEFRFVLQDILDVISTNNGIEGV